MGFAKTAATPVVKEKSPVRKTTKLDVSKERYTFTEETKLALRLPTFDNWQWDESEMAKLLEVMFIEMGVIEPFKIEIPKLRAFLHRVKDNYNKNPFHNFRHCFCVTQMVAGMWFAWSADSEKMYGMVNCMGLIPSKPGETAPGTDPKKAVGVKRFLNDKEKLILLVSCICHDIDHPGMVSVISGSV